MTIASLRSLHAIIGDAIADIERVYALHGYLPTRDTTNDRQKPQNPSPVKTDAAELEVSDTTATTSRAYVSPPPSPSTAASSPSALPAHFTTNANSPVDFPSLDAPCDATSLSEALTSDPAVLNAIGRIVAAAGQLSATVQLPFLTLCDSIMGYHLPSCMRLLEASHVVEILHEAGPQGLHVQEISKKNGVKTSKLAHILRLLATHHLLRELSPDVFTLNRISSSIDSGKMFADLEQYWKDGMPEKKYQDTNGIAAFVGLCSDEIQKASAYMTETYYLSPSKQTREGQEPTLAPFCFAFDTVKTGTGFFGWLEGEVGSTPNADMHPSVETGAGAILPPALGIHQDLSSRKSQSSKSSNLRHTSYHQKIPNDTRHSNSNRFRLERFGKAMSGTDGWEAPGAALNGFDWNSLPYGSIVVDVGGGIGSTSMLLATAFSSSTNEDDLGLKFIIQDRPVVCEMGEKAWKTKCPDLLQSTVRFQVHDFFTPQPVKNAAVFLLRVVLHDWPDDYARKILLHLRDAATPDTKLLIADFILPLACPEDMGSDGGLDGIEGAEPLLAPSPLLPNFGKASANVYWMDLTMQVMFNAQERTLREMNNLAASAGWKIVKVTRTVGSLFGYLVAVPVSIPVQEKDATRPSSPSNFPTKDALSIQTQFSETSIYDKHCRDDLEVGMDMERVGSRCGTPTFGSGTRLSSMQEALMRFGGGVIRPKSAARSFSAPTKPPPVTTTLKPALTLAPSSSITKKKRPSPLSVPPVQIQSSPSPVHSSPIWKPPSNSSSPRRERLLAPPSLCQPAQSPGTKIIKRRASLAHLRPTPSQDDPPPPVPTLPPSSSFRHPPPSPLSPLYPPSPSGATPRPSHPQVQATGSTSNALSAAQSSSSSPPQRVTSTAKSGLLAASPIHSMIPVRAVVEPTSPSSSHLLHPRTAATIPPATRQTGPVIARRASNAQLLSSQTVMASRKRSGTVIGHFGGGSGSAIGASRSAGDSADPRPIGLNAGSEGGSFSGISGLRKSGTVLRFDEDRRGLGGGGGGYVRQRAVSTTATRRTQTESPSGDMPIAGCASVLAAAARIDRGEFVPPPASP
ncbi:hypothetical protein CPC08DRAFT_665869, partial [Agrocybe pediades]